METIIQKAHRAVAEGRSDHSRQWWLAEMQKRADASRQPGQSPQQSFARFCETSDGLAMLRASRVAMHYTGIPEIDLVQKRLRDDPEPDTATARLSRLCLQVKRNQPYLDDDAVCEKVLSHPSNDLLAAEFRRENGLAPVAKASGPLARFGRLSDSLVRAGHVNSHDEAAKRVAMSHPALTARAKAESDRLQAEEDAGWDDLEGIGKGVRIMKGSKVAADAAMRLQAIASRLYASGNYGSQDSAWARTVAANRQMADLAQVSDTLPDGLDLESLEPTETKFYPNRTDPTPANRSAARLPVRAFDQIGKGSDRLMSRFETQQAYFRAGYRPAK